MAVEVVSPGRIHGGCDGRPEQTSWISSGMEDPQQVKLLGQKCHLQRCLVTRPILRSLLKEEQHTLWNFLSTLMHKSI